MKYKKLKIWALIISVILLCVGYYLYKFSDRSISDNFGQPLFNLMQFLVYSTMISFLITKHKIYKIWGITSMFALAFIAIEIMSSPVSCSGFMPLLCDRYQIASIFGFFYFCLTIIFVVISLVWSLVTYFKSKKLNKNI